MALTHDQHRAITQAATSGSVTTAHIFWGSSESRRAALDEMVDAGYLKRVDTLEVEGVFTYEPTAKGKKYAAHRVLVKPSKWAGLDEPGHTLEVGYRWDEPVEGEPGYDVYLDGEYVFTVSGYQSTPYNVHGRIRYDLATRRAWVINEKGYANSYDTRVEAIEHEANRLLRERKAAKKVAR